MLLSNMKSGSSITDDVLREIFSAENVERTRPIVERMARRAAREAKVAIARMDRAILKYSTK
jgi:hypothetical protein